MSFRKRSPAFGAAVNAAIDTMVEDGVAQLLLERRMRRAYL
jgi:hypothetical protein